MQRLFLFLLLCIGPMLGWAQSDNWELSRERDSVRVYTRQKPGTRFRQLKAEMTVAQSPASLLALVKDDSVAQDWISSIKSFETIARSPQEWYTYAVVGIPWPFQDRDLVSRNRLRRDTASGGLSVSIVSVPDYIPEQGNKARMQQAEGEWQFVPTAAGDSTRVTYIFYSEPEASILPTWLVTSIVTNGVLNTLKNMRALVRQPAYNVPETD